MKKKFIVLLALLLSACRYSGSDYSPASQMPDSSEVIDVTQAILNPGQSKEFTFESLDLVFLETNEQSILSKINEIAVASSRIIVNDRYKYGGVVLFDTSGKYIMRLPHGEASYELGQASKIFCTDEFLFVHDAAHNKISKYSLNGEFLSGMYLDAMLVDFAFINGDLFLLSDPGQNSLRSHVLIKYDSIPANCQAWEVGPGKFLSYGQVNYLQHCNGGLNITLPLDENVYCYKDGAVYKKYSFLNGCADVDFSQYSDVLDMFDRLPAGVFVRSGHFWETADFQFCMYETYHSQLKEVFRSKKSGCVWTNKFKENSLLNFINIVGLADYEDNIFLGVINPYSLLADDLPADYRWDGSNPGNLVSEADMEKLRSVKPDDNPIIVLFKLKSDL